MVLWQSRSNLALTIRNQVLMLRLVLVEEMWLILESFTSIPVIDFLQRKSLAAVGRKSELWFYQLSEGNPLAQSFI